MRTDSGSIWTGVGTRLRSAVAAVLFTALGRPAAAAPPPAAPDASRTAVIISNGIVSIGVDPNKGGAITYLAFAADGRNIVNDHDLGREIQPSYYAGPKPYGSPIAPWTNSPWNPVASGDTAGHQARAQVTRQADGSLHLRSQPYQWALSGVLCECRFDGWISLDGNRVRIRQRLTNMRPDHNQYAADLNEVPAVYVNTFLRRIVSYTGARPFTGDAPARPAATWPTQPLTATENWVALVDGNDRGVGVINFATTHFDVGVSEDRDGGEHDGWSGYISPRQRDILDYNIVYDTNYTLVLGTVTEIRAAARALRPADTRPSYVFARDRQGWHYVNARDTGWPIAGRLRITATQGDPQMIGPLRSFAADTAPALYVTGAFQGGTRARLFWATIDQPGFSEARSVEITVTPDGVMRSVRIPTATAPGWSGLIAALRFDLPGGAGARADICAIAWRPTAC